MNVDMLGKKVSSVLSIAQLWFASLGVKIISIPLLAFYARYLTKQELSLIPVYLMIGHMSVLLFNFGILPVFVKLIPSKLDSDYEEARSLIFTGSLILLVGCLISCIGVYIFSESISISIFHESIYATLIRIMSIGFFFLGVKKILLQILWCTSRFGKMSIITISQTSLKAVLTVALYLLKGIEGLVLGLVLTDIITAAMALYYMRDVLFKGMPRFYSLKKLAKVSMPFYLESYLMYFRAQGDQWIVTAFLGPSSLAIYYIAKRLYGMVLTMFESFDKVITASLSRKRHNKNAFEDKVSELFPLISYIIFPFIFTLIGLTPFLIDLIAGQKYLEAVFPAIFLFTTILINFFWRPTIGRPIFILRPSMNRFKLTLIESVLLLVSLLLFTRPFGVTGVASARLVACAITGIYAFFVIKKSIRIKIPIKEVTTSLVASLSICVVILLGQSFYYSYLMVPIYCLSGMLMFLVIINMSISEEYYSAINSVLPFKVKDPVRIAKSFFS